MFFKQFGGKVTQALKAQYQQSPNWQKGSFQNLEHTPIAGNLRDIPSMLYKQLTLTKDRSPKQPLLVLPFDQTAFLSPADRAKLIWYGHSAVLLRINNKTILIDPMLGPDTTPIAPIPTKRFSENTLAFIDDFPPIDLVVFTHDHYDHLDYASVQKLKPKVKQFYTSLGVKRHLVSWGVDPNIVTELDWWDTKKFHNIDITLTPTRHFSGRGLTDRQKSFWGGWAFKTATENIWFSGDGGYGSHFKEVGKRLGPFDFALMECGQYNDDWRPVHLFPDESVQGAVDAGVRKAMPVHWAGFSLSYQHTWWEPAEEFVAAAEAQGIEYLTPKLGEMFSVSDNFQEKWWEQYM